jgi:hypothetical protein
MGRSKLLIFSLLLGCTPALAQYEGDRAKPCNAACRAWIRSDQAYRPPAYVVFDVDDDDGYDDAQMRPSPVGTLKERNGFPEARKATTGPAPSRKWTRAAAGRSKPVVAARKIEQTYPAPVRSRAAAKKREARTAEPKVGDLVLFGAIAPTAQKPVAPKLVPRGPARKLANAGGPEPKSAGAKVAAPPTAHVADAPRSAPSQTPATRDVTERRERADASMAQRKVADPKVAKAQIPEAPKDAVDPQAAATPEPLSPPPQEVAVAAPHFNSATTNSIDPTTQNTGRQSNAEPPPKAAVGASTEEAATTAEPANEVPIAEEDAVMPEPDLQVAALGSGVQALPTGDAAVTTPPSVVEPPAKTLAAPAAPEAPLVAPAPTANLSPADWGDEKKLIETLRADWKSTPVATSFQVGQQVPSEILLKPLPPSLASRDQGVNMHYFIANADAVLVLPRLRVVVDVYHSPEASLADR